MTDSYLTVENKVETLYKEKGSKFFSFVFPVKDLSEVKSILDELKKKYYDATHHCYAYILGFEKEVFRMNDDGEPSSTAGKPIYGQLQSKNLTNVLLVVIRYFGGTKLGVSGLIKAYKTAAAECLSAAMIVEKKVRLSYKVMFPYEKMNAVMSLLKEIKAEQTKHIFETECSMEVLVESSQQNKFEDAISKIFLFWQACDCSYCCLLKSKA